MKSFGNYITEGGYHVPVVSVDNTKVDMAKEGTMLEINRNLAAVLSQSFVNPYSAYTKCAKVLRNYGVELPRKLLSDKISGSEIIVIHQFGGTIGANLDGTITPPNSHDEKSEYYLVFSYIQLDGFYKCRASVVSEDDVNEIAGSEEEEQRNELGDRDARQP